MKSYMIKLIFIISKLQIFALCTATDYRSWHGRSHNIYSYMISGFCCGAHEVFALLECHAALTGSWLLTFWDTLNL